MEHTLPSKKCPTRHNSVPRRPVQKVNKCIQVDMDLEEENPGVDLSLSPPTCFSKKRQQSPGKMLPPQQGASLSSPQRSAVPATQPTPPAPPALPPGCEMLPPPPPRPGTNTLPLPPPLPCSDPACNHLARGCTGQPCAEKAKTPTLRMKVFHWQKLPSDVVRHSLLESAPLSLWSILKHPSLPESCSMWAAVAGGSKELVEPDYTSLELLFCVPPAAHKEKTRPKTKKSKEITFIGLKKSLLLNIFLKQFKCSTKEIAEMIHKGDGSKFDAEVLKQLFKLLPEEHEIKSLKSCKEEKSELANTDQFYLHLLKVPNYQLRIECMLACEETKVLLDSLWPKAQAIRRACETLLTSHRLPIFCQLILKVGNFLNYGHHSGDAGGFEISALLKLTDTKANQSHITLLHHILEEVDRNHRDLLQLPSDLDFVSKAVGIHFEVLQAEADANMKKLLEIEKHLLMSTDDLKVQHGKSIQGSISASKDLQKEFSIIEKKKEELADYLCEDRKRICLEDIFTTMKTFRELFLKALQENRERKEQAAKSEKRKKQLKGEEAKRLKGEYGNISTFNKS